MVTDATVDAIDGLSLLKWISSPPVGATLLIVIRPLTGEVELPFTVDGDRVTDTNSGGLMVKFAT